MRPLKLLAQRRPLPQWPSQQELQPPIRSQGKCFQIQEAMPPIKLVHLEITIKTDLRGREGGAFMKQNTILKLNSYPKMIQDFAHENFNLKVLSAVLLGTNIIGLVLV